MQSVPAPTRARVAFVLAVVAGLAVSASQAQSVHRASVPIVVGPNVQVSKANATMPHAENLAVGDPGHPGRLLTCSMVYPAEVGNRSGQYCYVSFDGGAVWEPTLELDEGRMNGDPTAVYGAGDDVYVVTLNGSNPEGPRLPASRGGRRNANMVVFKSSDGGRTWDGGTRFPFMDREYITRDATGGEYDGRIYLVGQAIVPGASGPGPGIKLFRSLDGAKTLLRPATAAYPEGTRTYSVGGGVVLSDGTFVAMFGRTKPGREQTLGDDPTVEPNAELHAIRSTDGGETLGSSVKIADWRVDRERSEGAHMGQLVADPGSAPFKDRLYAVFPMIVAGRVQIQLSYSADRGMTWSKPVVVNDDRSPVDGRMGPDHLLPAVGVNRQGVVLVAWYDRREATDNLGWRLRAAASLDGGETFSASVPVADAANAYTETTPWDLQGGAVSNAAASVVSLNIRLRTFFTSGGHTSGMAVDADGTFHPTWIDNRTGVAQLWTSSVEVAGTVAKHGAPDLANLEDVSGLVSFELSRMVFDRATGTLTLSAQLRNTTADSIEGPVKVRVLALESELGIPEITNADNEETGTGAVWDFSEQIAGNTLAPMALSEARTLTFRVSDIRALGQGKDFTGRVLNLDTRVFARSRR